ncbi:glycolipid transfer protein 2-like [Phalaenopsis equestris]|uniref:glycolipid transfer protein 2-like n=1 Tax=Phalaenopsis equestris TaxID=78828 RepID=UPI0009E20344|nr:glycolipid transfer protein 2-like [Phalaenopsis equestris]
MKRPAEEVKRDDGFPTTEIRAAAEELSVAVKQEDHNPSTLLFLAPSKSLLHILDKIGPTMAVLRQDVKRNIERLEKLYLMDPSRYSSLGEILKKEMEDGTARKRESCSRAILWLTRSMNFSLALLQFLEKEPEWGLDQIVEESYQSTLKPWHGWISSAAYKVALKLIPEKEELTSFLMGSGQDSNSLRDDIHMLTSLLRPFLDEINVLLRKFRLDKIKST